MSPLLSNIYLTPYDRELEQRGLRFVRYADDCNIFTKSKRSSYRVRDSVKSYLERKTETESEHGEDGSEESLRFLLSWIYLPDLRETGKLGIVTPQKKEIEEA